MLLNLQVYNETQYALLNCLDHRFDLPTFPTNAHSAAINSLSLDPLQGRFLLSGCADSSIKLWDLQNTVVERDEERVHEIDYHPAQKYHPVCVIPRRSVHEFGVTKVKWWPDNGMWPSSSFDFKMSLYDTNTMQVAHSFKLGSRISDFDFHPLGDSSTVVCCLDGGVGGLKLLDLRVLSDSQNLGGGGKSVGGVGYMNSCAWSPASSYLCLGGGIDGACYGWDIRSSGKYLFELDSNTTPAVMNAESISGRSRMKRKRVKANAHHDSINSMVFNETGTELITMGTEEKVRVWDMCTYRKPVNRGINFGPLIRNKGKQHVEMCISPALQTDISFLWVPSDSGEILVYRVDDGALFARLNRSTSANTTFKTAASRKPISIVAAGDIDGQVRFFSGCRDGNLCVWGGDSRRTIPTHPTGFDNGVDEPGPI